MDYENKKIEALEELKQCHRFDTEPAKTILKLFPELEESDYVIKRKLLNLLTYFRSKGIDHTLCDRIQNWIEKQGGGLIENGHTDNKDVIKYADEYSYAIWHKLMDNFKNIKDYQIGCNDVSDIVLNAIIDACNWFKKQDKQKPTNKIEPKFKVGDWIVKKDGTTFYNGKTAVQIKHIYENRYLFDDSTYVYAEEVRLWTIQDAKSGDILTKSKRAFIFKDFSDSKHPGCPTAYCGINCENEFYTDSQENNRWTESKKVKPANEEQCNLLFQKMKKAGYKWDKNTKELKRVK